MKNNQVIKYILLGFLLVNLYNCKSENEDKLNNNLSTTINAIANQFEWFHQKNVERFSEKRFLPRTIENDSVRYVGIYDWTSGFYPGSLWYLNKLTENNIWKERAMTYTKRLDTIKHWKGLHDVGFMIGSSFGNAYRVTENEAFADVIIETANSLSTRYNPIVGSIKSWDWSSKWEFPVIIDNMMNLELLFKASELSGDQKFYNLAVQHAKTTMKNHFREDGSSYHVVNFNKESGEVKEKVTHQGYSNESVWARGQAWGLYGYTMTFRETKDKVFLNQAIKIADFIKDHPELPEDKVPYWDFSVEKMESTKRDASAGAIIASALLELQAYVDSNKSKAYMKLANEIIASLSSEKYLAAYKSNKGFILKHSVGSLPGNKEVDEPLNYADYYFLEAIYRLKQIQE